MPSPWMILLNTGIGAVLAAWTNKWAVDIIVDRVLPKKKHAFARDIQKLVSTELLSPDKIGGKLAEPQVGDVFRHSIDQVLADYLTRDLPSPDECFAAHRAELDRLTAALRDLALDEVFARFEAPDFRDAVLRPWLAREWESLVHRSPRSLLPKPTARLSAALPPWVEGLQHSAALRRNCQKALAKWLAGRLTAAHTFSDLLPPTLRAMLLDWTAEQAPFVGDRLAEALATPDMQATVADAVLAAVRQQLAGQGSVFGRLKSTMAGLIGLEDDIRGFCRRLPDTLRQTFAQPDCRDQLAQALRDGAASWLNRPLPIDFHSPEQSARWVGMLLDHIWQPSTFRELGERLARVLDEVLRRSLGETAFRLGLDVEASEAVDLAALKLQQGLTAPSTRALLAERLDEAVTAWRQKPLGRLERLVPPASREKVAALAADETRRLIQSRLADFAEQSGIWNLVSESIVGRSDAELAGLIRGLANSEFKKITLLGAAIGTVVGFAQSFVPDLVAWMGG